MRTGLQDTAGEREARPAVRRVGVPALLDGNVGEQILEGAGARFVGSDALGNRSRTHHSGCVLLHPPASAVTTSAAHDRLPAERARADRRAVEVDLMALSRLQTRGSATGGRQNAVVSLARPRCAIVSWSLGIRVCCSAMSRCSSIAHGRSCQGMRSGRHDWMRLSRWPPVMHISSA